MRIWLQHHFLSLTQTLRRLLRSPFATLLNVAAIGIAVALPTGTYCVLGNIKSFSSRISPEPQLSVFLSRDAGKSDVAAVEARLRSAVGVGTVRFVDRNTALADLKRAPGMADVVTALRDNPLPDAFVVTLATADPALMDRFEHEFAALPKVVHVQSESVWVKRLDALLRLGRTTVVVLGALLGLALVAVTFNTIRLQILTQRDEIEVCRLIGATNAYIRRPFFYLGSLLGLAGGLTALAIVLAALTVLNRDLAQLATLYGSDFRLRPLAPEESAAVLGLSLGLGWLGAYLSVSKYLRENTEN